jgi:glycosyltransferase involved in cell wall biosynthesis
VAEGATVDRPTIVIAVLTYQRPGDLEEVIPAVQREIDRAGRNASLLIVDNDPSGSAMPGPGETSPPRVRFVHEPVPGIAAARNRALEETVGADLVVFLDDDERPEPGWLDALVSTWERTGAAAVVGPVISTYAQEPEPWIAAGRFFDRRRLPTGTEITVAATNNLLLDVQQLGGLRFDLDFGITGGSDTLFTRQIHRRGGRLVWCDEARVLDVVPATRLTRRWVLRKALRTGNSWSRVTLALEPSAARRLGSRAVLTAQGLVRIAGGLARLLVGAATRSMGQRARGARTLARGLGMTGGAWGHTVTEYHRPSSP